MAVSQDDRQPTGQVPRWELVVGILSAAMDKPRQERTRFLREACGDSRDLLDEVQALLAAEEESLAFLEGTPLRVRPALDREGQRAGNWILGEKLGEGGMGVVYRARRAGGDFEQSVAVKLYAFGPSPTELERRFRSELKILSLLDHPNITRLHDAGSTQDGVPFLAMELVEGLPLLEYCRKFKLDSRARISLFARILRTVHYAHLHLIVHRDIKPSNILMTLAGEPKLLDFGIARVLETTNAQPDATATLYRAASIHYASPEQLRGRLVTTATDTYSLGILLYELLSEKRWPAPDAPNLDDLIRAIEAAPPPKVSEAKPDLDPDLDAIIARATRAEAVARYRSADDFAADLDRFLEGKPVEARRGKAWYVIRKLAARHKLAFACTAAATVATIGGLLAFAAQTRRTDQERTRAERGFAISREIVNRNLFDHYGKLSRIPGTYEVRRAMTHDMLGYLDQLAASPVDDRSLTREIAEGYLRTANLLGVPNQQNLADPQGAEETYQKALAISRRLLDLDPSDCESLRVFAQANNRLNDFWIAQRRWKPVIELTNEYDARLMKVANRTRILERQRVANQLGRLFAAIEIGEAGAAELDAFLADFTAFTNAWNGSGATASQLRDEAAGQYGPRGRIAILQLTLGDPVQAELSTRIAMDQSQRAVDNPPVIRFRQARFLALLGLTRLEGRKYFQAEQDFLQALAIVRQLAVEEPDSPQNKTNLVEILTNLGSVQARLGKESEARQSLAEALALAPKVAGLVSTTPAVVFAAGKSAYELALLAPPGSERCRLLGEAEDWFHQNESKGISRRFEKPVIEASARQLGACAAQPLE